MMTLKSLIFEKLKNGGLNKNDVVMLHSNIGPLFKFLKKQKYNFEVKDIAECIMEYFSSNGTLIIPTFNFEFCKGKSFSLKNTPSKMGVLSEEFRIISQKNRTWHPVYSFSIFGKIPKRQIENRNYSAFGKVTKGMEFIDKIKRGEGPNGSVENPDKIITLRSKK